MRTPLTARAIALLAVGSGSGATDTISVKGGSLDEPPDLRSACHIRTVRALPGVVIPETARQSLGEPE